MEALVDTIYTLSSIQNHQLMFQPKLVHQTSPHKKSLDKRRKTADPLLRASWANHTVALLAQKNTMEAPLERIDDWRDEPLAVVVHDTRLGGG